MKKEINILEENIKLLNHNIEEKEKIFKKEQEQFFIVKKNIDEKEKEILQYKKYISELENQLEKLNSIIK